MNKIQQFAKALKDRKNPKAGKARSDAPLPVPPCGKVPAGVSRLERLKGERARRQRAARQG